MTDSCVILCSISKGFLSKIKKLKVLLQIMQHKTSIFLDSATSIQSRNSLKLYLILLSNCHKIIYSSIIWPHRNGPCSMIFLKSSNHFFVYSLSRLDREKKLIKINKETYSVDAVLLKAMHTLFSQKLKFSKKQLL